MLWWSFFTKIVFHCCFVVGRGVVAVLPFVVYVAAEEFDVVIPAVFAAVAFHFVVVLVLFVVAAVASDFEIDDVDFAVTWYFLEINAGYFVDHDDAVESAVCRLHFTVLVDILVFFLRVVRASNATVWVSIRSTLLLLFGIEIS